MKDQGKLTRPFKAEHTPGPLSIRALDIFLGYASPCLMGLFTPKNLIQMFEYLPILRCIIRI
jgi:hypothetical protein